VKATITAVANGLAKNGMGATRTHSERHFLYSVLPSPFICRMIIYIKSNRVDRTKTKKSIILLLSTIRDCRAIEHYNDLVDVYCSLITGSTISTPDTPDNYNKNNIVLGLNNCELPKLLEETHCIDAAVRIYAGETKSMLYCFDASGRGIILLLL